MQLTRFALAAVASGALAASTDLVDDLHGHHSPLLLAPRQNNLQTFADGLGGIKAEPIIKTGDAGHPFKVGADLFVDFRTAAERSCDTQKTNCARAANAKEKPAAFHVSDCEKQNTACRAAIAKEAAVVAASASSGAANAASTPNPVKPKPRPNSNAAAVAGPPTPPPPPPPPSPPPPSAPPPHPVTSTAGAHLQLVTQNAQFNFFCEV